MAWSGARLVRRDGAWDLVWPAGMDRPALPATTGKYELVQRAGPAVAGRPTSVVDVARAGVTQERLYLDLATGLILRRQELDGRGKVRREVAFERLIVTSGAPLPAPPVPVADRSPRVLAAAADLGRPYRAPAALAGGYRRVGTYRRPQGLQVLYSDGLYSLSVFEERGRLDHDAIPAGGQPVGVRGHRGWHYAWPGGEVVLWQAGDAVFTAVGEAPVDDVLAAVASMPGATRPTTVDRLRRACRALLETFR